MCRFVSNSYFHDDDNKIQIIATGPSGNGRFYKATNKYYFPKMCNLWSAKALEAAGCPVDTTCIITSEEIMS